MCDLKDFGLLSIGACGGNQVAAFKKYNINSFYINSALQDLQSLGLQDMHYYHLKGAQGCHKNRDVSKRYLAQNYEDIIKNVERYLTGKYIFLFGSTGGGTSSGMCALMTQLLESELNKIVIPIVTVPTFTESPQAKTNCYEALKELFACAKHSVLLVDNNKESDFIKSNTTLANLIYNLISDVSNSTDGIYDYSEICAMLEQKGYGIINGYSRKPTQIDITSNIKSAIKNTIFVDAEPRNSLYYCGIKSSIMRKTSTINFDELQLEFGYWRDVFQGYQTKSDLIFLSGLQYPASFINKLYESIQADKKKIELDKAFNSTIEFKDDYGLDFNSNVLSTEKEVVESARDQLLKLLRS